MLRRLALVALLLPGAALAQQQDPDQATIDNYLDATDPDAPLVIRDPFGTGSSAVGLDTQAIQAPGAIDEQPLDPMTGRPVDPIADPLPDQLQPLDDGTVQSEEIARTQDASQDFEVPMVDAPRARLRGLDTLTNTVNDFEIGVGETLAFKRLIVTLEACRYPEGEIGTEAYAYLRIRDRREEQDRFSGWMLASSPALSALDHPRYDVWVLSCSME